MLIVKLTIDRVSADGIEIDLETSLTVRDDDALADGVQALCTDVLEYLAAEHTEAVADTLTGDAGGVDLATPEAPPTGCLPTLLSARELKRLRMTVENEDVRDRAGRFDPIASADDLAIVLPILRRLIATHAH